MDQQVEDGYIWKVIPSSYKQSVKDIRYIESAGMSSPVKVGRSLTDIGERVESPSHCLRYSLVDAGDTLSPSDRVGKPS